MTDNSERIKRAREALDVYEGSDEALIDLLADLHHLAAHYNYDIDYSYRVAKGHFYAELGEE